MKKISTIAKNVYSKGKAEIVAAMAGITAIMASPTAFCDAAITAKDPSQIVKDVVSLICQIIQYAGVILLVWGVIQLVLAFKNEDGENKSKAALVLVCSVVLIGLKPLLNATVLSGMFTA